MTKFAVNICEGKIKEFYAEACDATIQFQRRLPVLSREMALKAENDLEGRMRELADKKKKEWRTAIATELIKRKRALEEKSKKIKAPLTVKKSTSPTRVRLSRSTAVKSNEGKGHGRAWSSSTLVDGITGTKAVKEKEEKPRGFMTSIKKRVKFGGIADSLDKQPIPSKYPYRGNLRTSGPSSRTQAHEIWRPSGTDDSRGNSGTRAMYAKNTMI